MKRKPNQREEKRSLVKSQVLLGKILKESVSNRSLEASISPTKNKISKKMKEIFWRTRILRAFELIVGRHINLPEGEVGTCVAICIEETPNDYYIQFLFSSNLHYREIRKYGYVTNWRNL